MIQRRILPVLVLALALFGLTGSVEGAPQAGPGPIEAGCYHVVYMDCRLKLDPFSVAVSPGARLVAVQVLANGSLVYDYRTDVSNPPGSGYSVSPVQLDFAAACGLTYTVDLLARDSADTSYQNVGQVTGVVCPAGQPAPTATATTPAPTPTATEPPSQASPARIFLPLAVSE